MDEEPNPQSLSNVNSEVISKPDLFKKVGLTSLITFIISVSLLEMSLDEVFSTFKLSILIVQLNQTLPSEFLLNHLICFDSLLVTSND